MFAGHLSEIYCYSFRLAPLKNLCCQTLAGGAR